MSSRAHELARVLHRQHGRVLLELQLHQYARAQEAMLDPDPEAGARMCRELREGFEHGRYTVEHMDAVYGELMSLLDAWDELIALAEPHWREALAALGLSDDDQARALLEDKLWDWDPQREPLEVYATRRLIPALEDPSGEG